MPTFKVLAYREWSQGDYIEHMRLTGERRYLLRIANRHGDDAHKARKRLLTVKARMRTIENRYTA